MKNSKLFLSLALVLLLVSFASAEMLRCTQCGMMVNADSKFSAKIVQGEKSLPFCDIGDLLAYVKKKSTPEAKPLVKDYKSGEWVDADKAFYVQSAKTFRTPMGWGIAAFRDKQEAATFGAVLDYSAMVKAL